MTSRYKKILLAIDFFEGNEVVIDAALGEAQRHEAELFILHVDQPAMVASGFDTLSWNTQVDEINQQVLAYKKEELKKLSDSLDVPEDHTRLMSGQPAERIHHCCDAENIDLIVLGTHGQHGLSLLLGSTASSVLHGTACDVLAVRIR